MLKTSAWNIKGAKKKKKNQGAKNVTKSQLPENTKGKSLVSGDSNSKGSITMSGILQHDVLTIIFIQPVTVTTLDVIIKGVIFIHTNRGLRLSHFNTHIQISEEQCMFIDHFLVPHYEGYFKNAQCMLVVWAILDLGKYLTFHHPLHISNKLTFSLTAALLYIHTHPWLLSFPK